MLLRDIHTDQLSIDLLEMHPGECWAVLARNGSGKQMLTGVITGDTRLKKGTVSHDFHHIGVLSFETQQALYERELKLDDSDFMDRLDPGTTVREMLGIEDQIPATLAFLNLDRILDRGYRLLSSGESRKALLAQVLLEAPDYLILDEPYDSLDVQTRTELQAFFASLAAAGNIQMLFLFNKADELSDWHTHVAIIEQGMLIARGEKDSVMADPAIASLLSFDPASLPDWPLDLPRPDLANPLVGLHHGKVQYGDIVIFSNVDLVLNQGDHTLLTGANGSGKSTLLNLITGDHPQCYGNDLQVLGYQRGSGESIWEVKKQIGIVSPGLHRDHRVPGSALHIAVSGFFDSIGLYDDPTADQVVHARQWLALVGMAERAGIPFKQLSYGEQRLVLIARALVKQPVLLILDEPTQGLDDVNRHRVMYFLEHLSSQHRTTIIMASHRLDERVPLFRHHLDMDRLRKM
jgi:molybdate transport system ATP-binding protein